MCLFAEVGNSFRLWKFIRILAFYLGHATLASAF